MCGIAGFINNSKKQKKEEALEKMLNRIIHRGPDAEGKYIDKQIALGHRRLSIIDLKSGNQPMFNEDGNIVIVFNGEIYNYQELKEELIQKNHIFKTTSDTEVIIHGYEEYGTKIASKLRGMFAFAIWDKKHEKLYAARDHFGIKPFYYYKQNDKFLFASEIKSFLDHPDFVKELNKEILPEYLRFNFSPTDETFFKNVYTLEPGSCFTYKAGVMKIKKYFTPTFNEKEQDYNHLVDEISKTMKDSVEKHMLSDVEVGSFLSSGIDSSYIVSLAKPDKTYTVGYENPKYDESEYAKDLADKLGINNTNKKISKREYFNALPEIMYHLDEPLADPAAIALFFVAKLASKDVKVVLSGEGADELFGGYNSYRRNVDAKLYNKIPFKIRKAISKIAEKFPAIRGFNFLVRSGQTLEEGYIGVNKVFTEKEAKKLVNFKCNPKTNMELTKKVYETNNKNQDISKMQAIDINFWLAKDILQKADKMTMAHSIEGRVPFTDIEVFKLARTIDEKTKVSKENTKLALRSAAKEVIPTEAYNKKKLGFPVPLRDWMKEEDIYGMIKDAFNTDISFELFNHKQIIKLLEDHKNGKRDNYKKVWTIFSFIIWYEEFFINEK